ncbi:acetoacetate decarboxylase family protein [Plantactinospora sp. CA-290183]|uniref:acetoacetate decarboxylase family protein n=1 Tax=Plantactinospora sp. CA-290183 TaxID=3240006 RepID=UPI003D8A3ABF
MSYPPEPWHLRGQMYVSVWSVPRRDLPPLPGELARVVRPVTLGGRGLIGTAWVVYEPGGVLHYRELLCAVLVRDGARPRVSITGIWVDSPTSRDGGRELWGIPKELAALEIGGTADRDGAGELAASAGTGSGPIARAVVRAGRRLPGRWPLRFSVAQLLGARVRTTPVRCRAGVGVGSAGWDVDPAGPLGYLAGRRPLFTLTLRDFRLVFGSAGAAAGRP